MRHGGGRAPRYGNYPRAVATFSAVTRQHILAAIAEHDDRGRESFLGVYGFTPSPGRTLVHEGRTYDATAILGVAHRYATGRLATPDELEGGKVAVATILSKRGFEATGATADAPARTSTRASTRTSARATRTAPARRASEPEKPPAICPTCFMAMPATGVCDSCG